MLNKKPTGGATYTYSHEKLYNILTAHAVVAVAVDGGPTTHYLLTRATRRRRRSILFIYTPTPPPPPPPLKWPLSLFTTGQDRKLVLSVDRTPHDSHQAGGSSAHRRGTESSTTQTKRAGLGLGKTRQSKTKHNTITRHYTPASTNNSHPKAKGMPGPHATLDQAQAR